METKRALITGITGQDGSYLAELLLEKGYEIYGMVRRLSVPNLKHIQNLVDNDCVTLIGGDLADQSSIVSAINISKPDEIYNLAAQSFVGESWNQAEYTTNITGLGALRVYESARQINKNIKIYQASSSEMYGNVPAPQSEDSEFKPRSPYGVAKLMAHNMARVYRESYDMWVSCGILFNHECATAETPVILRKNGIIDILPIEDVVPHRTEPKMSKYTTNVENSQLGPFEVWDNGGWTTVTCMTATWNGYDKSGRSYNKNKPVYRIVARGAIIQVTGDHIVYTMNKNMDITECWSEDYKKPEVIVGKPAWEIDLKRKPGDCLALIGLPEPTNVTILTEEEAWFIGAIVSDGYIGIKESEIYNSEQIKGRFSNKDIKLIEKVRDLWYKLTGGDTSIYMSESGYNRAPGEKDIYNLNLIGNSNYLRYIHDETYTRTGHKKIPKRVLNALVNVRLAFLRGYNAGDGTKGLSEFEWQAFTTESACLAQGLYWLTLNTLNQRATMYDFIKEGRTYYKILINASEDEKEVMGSIQPLEEIIRTRLVNYKGWVYDLATETGTFHAGIGQGWIHNSPRRGIEFVSQKIANGVARIKLGLDKELRLGNVRAKRDWGYSPDYVEAMWLMLNDVDKAEDFVISTGQSHSVRAFCQIAFDYVKLDWEHFVKFDKALERPAEIFDLVGDSNKARRLLGWKPKTSFDNLVKIMVDAQLEELRKR